MKFGKFLEQNRYAPWAQFYVDYKKLNKMLTELTGEKGDKNFKEIKDPDALLPWMAVLREQVYKVQKFVLELKRSYDCEVFDIEDQIELEVSKFGPQSNPAERDPDDAATTELRNLQRFLY